MKLTKFEISIGICMFGAWIQLMLGFTSHAFFVIGGLIVLCLMGIIGYLRMILEFK